jgi:hypothetical protein
MAQDVVGPIGCLGHFEFKPSPTEELLQVRELLFWRVVNFMLLQAEPSKDHQGQVRVITTSR